MTYEELRLKRSAQATVTAPAEPGIAVGEQDSSSSVVGLEDLARALGRRWKLIAAVGLLTALLAYAWASTLPPTFRAEGAMLVRSVPLTASDANTSYRDVMGKEVTVATELDFMNSEAFLARVAGLIAVNPSQMLSPYIPVALQGTAGEGAPQLKDKLDWLRSSLSLDASDESNVILATFSSPDPALSARVLDTVFEQYLIVRSQQRSDAVAEVVRGLQGRIASVESEMRAANAAALGNSAVLEGLGSAPIGEEIASLRTDFRQAEAAASLAQSRFEAARAALRASGNDVDRLVGIAQSPGLSALQTGLAELRQQEASMATTLGPRHPARIALQEERLRLEESVRIQAAEAVQALRTDYLAARNFQQRLESRVHAAGSAAQGGSSSAVALQSAMAKVETLRLAAERMRGELEQILARADIPTSQIVSAPFPPVNDRSPSSIVAAVLGGALGTALMGFGIILKTQFGGQGPLDAAQAQRILQAPVLGGVPDFKASRATRDVKPRTLNENGSDALSESFLAIFTQLEGDLATGAARSVLVTSAEEGEGKSTTVAFLGTQAANCNRRVLVIDADLRRPAQEHLLVGDEKGETGGISSHPEIGGLSLECWKAQNNSLTLLSLASSGEPPHLLFRSEAMVTIMEWAEANFDIVLVDSPPVLACADAILLARFVERLIVVASASTSPSALREVARRLHDAQLTISGIILTKLALRAEPSHYSTGYEPGPANRRATLFARRPFQS